MSLSTQKPLPSQQRKPRLPPMQQPQRLPRHRQPQQQAHKRWLKPWPTLRQRLKRVQQPTRRLKPTSPPLSKHLPRQMLRHWQRPTQQRLPKRALKLKWP